MSADCTSCEAGGWTEETGWLIERPEESNRWLTLEDGQVEWTRDASKALRFARKMDGEMFRDNLLGSSDYPVNDHMWSG